MLRITEIFQGLAVNAPRSPRLKYSNDPPANSTESRSPHWNCTGDIEYQQINFSYATAKHNALTGINLKIPAGSSLAVVGATGSGKTTLLQLLGRFYDPTGGQVLVDGHDVRTLDPTQLRQQIGIVSQDTLLFSATVAENIAFGQPDASQQDIEHAARIAQAHEFIVQMAAGYQTRIGERGVGLSQLCWI